MLLIKLTGEYELRYQTNQSVNCFILFPQWNCFMIGTLKASVACDDNNPLNLWSGDLYILDV